MVAKAWGERVDSKASERTLRGAVRASQVVGSPAPILKRGVEEMFVQNDTVSLCLLLNRRTKTMRVIDFRAGPSHAKRIFVLRLAKREGIEKVYTLVERDEVSTWVKLGFAKEANIAGFYKRSDAFILGCSVDAANVENQLRVPIGLEEDEDPVADEPSPAHDFAEKTLAHAKKHAKELSSDAHARALPPTKIAVVRETDAAIKKTIDKAIRSGRALTAFEAFGRDVERRFFHLTSRGGFELVASTESQSCFGNAFIELLTGPKSEPERVATIAALRTLCDKLLAEGVVSCFSMSPSDDVALATAFVFNGFRRTGLLQNHVTVGGVRRDAIVWSRKLANPADE
ncbi:MAG: hypothetical protein JWP87_377 [Labilithrix sp.]|nr:hypothetical protein [Labilithrix sp.]